MEQEDSTKDQDISKEIKQDYDNLKGKYNLPSFEQLAEDFDIEKICEKPSSFLLREIRRAISEKLIAYHHLFETLINPSSPPMFVFSVLKNTNDEDKKLLKEVYKKLSRSQISAMKLDTIYSEQAEADFIKSSFTTWQDLKVKIHNLMEKFDKEFEKEHGTDKRGYFG
jgi:hypothetical protein